MAARTQDDDPDLTDDPTAARQALLDGMSGPDGLSPSSGSNPVGQSYIGTQPTGAPPLIAPNPTTQSFGPTGPPATPAGGGSYYTPGQTVNFNTNPDQLYAPGSPNPNAPSTGQTAQQYLSSDLSGGVDPQRAVDLVNQQYNLGSGQGAEYYAPGAHGAGSGAVIGLAGIGGYYAQQPDGSWQFEQSAEQNGGGSGGSDNPYTVNINYQPYESPFNAQMANWLNSELTNYSTPITADSPTLQPAISAYDVQSQRDEAAARDQIAEELYASSPGGTALQSGALPTMMQQNMEAAAGNRANFAGNAVMQANSQERQELVQLLGTATQYGLTDQAQQIQQRIAALDAQLQEQGLQQSFATGNNQLAFDYANLLANENQNAFNYGLNG